MPVVLQSRPKDESTIQGEDGDCRPAGSCGGSGGGCGGGARASGVPDRATGRSEVPTPSGEAGMSLHERPQDVPTGEVGNTKERVGEETGPRPSGRVNEEGAVVGDTLRELSQAGKIESVVGIDENVGIKGRFGEFSRTNMILIISNTQDLTADFVVREITRRHLRFARLNTDEFPVNASAAVRIAHGEAPSGTLDATLEWSNRERILDWSEVTSVWYRRPVTPVVDSTISDPGVREFAENESYEFLRGLWYSLNCYWMSHPDAIRRAEHKIVQLHEARRCGFLIPRTVVTNSPEEVRRLRGECPSGIIIKPLYLGFLKQQEKSRFIYTTCVPDSDLEESDSIRYAPSIYQEYVAKAADIRVTIVGNRVFAAKIIASELPANIPDWRYAEYETLHHEEHELPSALQESCIALVRRLRLEFGAVDLALTEANEYVFLEINANGQWAWLESAVGAEISSAIVDRLAAGER